MNLQDLQPLLDEATDLTQELRGRPIVVSPGTFQIGDGTTHGGPGKCGENRWRKIDGMKSWYRKIMENQEL